MRQAMPASMLFSTSQFPQDIESPPRPPTGPVILRSSPRARGPRRLNWPHSPLPSVTPAHCWNGVPALKRTIWVSISIATTESTGSLSIGRSLQVLLWSPARELYWALVARTHGSIIIRQRRIPIGSKRLTSTVNPLFTARSQQLRRQNPLIPPGFETLKLLPALGRGTLELRPSKQLPDL